MAPKKKGSATGADPNEVVHVQAKPGHVVSVGDFVYGDRATIQVRRKDLGELVGEYDVVDPANVPDAADR